jgi:hypothetical protein
MTKQKISPSVRGVLALTYVGLLNVSCASGYNQPKQQQPRGMTEAELAYRVRELQIVLDGAFRTGNPYEAQRASGELTQLAISYPQVCPIALDADLQVRNAGIVPVPGVQQICQ